MGTDGDDRGLVQDDAAIAHINKGIGSAQIDRQIAGKHATQFLEHGKRALGQTRGEKSAANSNNGAKLGQGESPGL